MTEGYEMGIQTDKRQRGRKYGVSGQKEGAVNSAAARTTRKDQSNERKAQGTTPTVYAAGKLKQSWNCKCCVTDVGVLGFEFQVLSFPFSFLFDLAGCPFRAWSCLRRVVLYRFVL